MKKYIVSAFMVLAPSAVLAADVSVPQDISVINATDPSVSEPVSERWGGAYLGISVGQAYLEDTAPATGKGAIYGGYAGYNYQAGHFVSGIEFSADNADIAFTDGSGIKSKFLYSARVRAGWANEKVFVYGSIGAQHGVTNLPNPFAKDTALQLGAGVDLALTEKISVGVDYTYAKYNKFAGFTFFGNTVDVTTQKVQARVSYTFN